jgi:hypothetical protein
VGTGESILGWLNWLNGVGRVTNAEKRGWAYATASSNPDVHPDNLGRLHA